MGAVPLRLRPSAVGRCTQPQWHRVRLTAYARYVGLPKPVSVEVNVSSVYFLSVTVLEGLFKMG